MLRNLIRSEELLENWLDIPDAKNASFFNTHLNAVLQVCTQMLPGR